MIRTKGWEVHFIHGDHPKVVRYATRGRAIEGARARSGLPEYSNIQVIRVMVETLPRDQWVK